MTVIDASAVCAIYLPNENGEPFLDYMSWRRGECVISPVNYWEVIRRARTWRSEEGAATAQTLMSRLQLSVSPIDENQLRLALDGARRFGKGLGGRLNMGDCFAYALAASLSAPLLYDGQDFSTTDVRSAI